MNSHTKHKLLCSYSILFSPTKFSDSTLLYSTNITEVVEGPLLEPSTSEVLV